MRDLVKKEQDGIVVSENAKRYIRKSKAANTLRTYKAAWREFENFAEQRGVEALPASSETVIEYLAALADSGAKPSTIGVKLAAIATAHRTAKAPTWWCPTARSRASGEPLASTVRWTLISATGTRAPTR